MFKKLNNKGFSHIETFLFVIVIATITGVGFFVYSRNQAHAGSLCGSPLVAYGSADSASKNSCVKDLQTMLNTLNKYKGSDVLAVDGIFGPLTKAAVKEFQTNNKLTADGMAGPYTFQKLCSIATPVGAPAAYATAKKDACTAHADAPVNPAKPNNAPNAPVNPANATVKSSTVKNSTLYKNFYSKVSEAEGICIDSLGSIFLPDWQTNPGEYLNNCKKTSELWGKTMSLYAKFTRYATESGYTNGNDRNTGGADQNQGPIGVKSSTCHNSEQCTQGVLTRAMAYSVVCGDLATQNSNKSIALTCYAYNDTKNRIDSIYVTIKDYNANLGIISSQSNITPQMKTNFENDINKINANLATNESLMNSLQSYLKKLNSDIWNSVNGNDYLTAYSKIHKDSFCAIYDFDHTIGGPNGSGSPLTINTTNYASQTKCKNYGLAAGNGKATVWWNNGSAVQAYGWN